MKKKLESGSRFPGRCVLMLALICLGGVGICFGQTQDEWIGTWISVTGNLTEELVISPDLTFVYTSEKDAHAYRTNGTYSVSDGTLRLVLPGGAIQSLTLSPSGLITEVNGQRFVFARKSTDTVVQPTGTSEPDDARLLSGGDAGYGP